MVEAKVHSEEVDIGMRAQGNVIEMGYCFGVDYIVVYRHSPEGYQLLGNSSANSTAIIPPADLQGRIHTNRQQDLLGLQITNLTHMDSGIYRRECWQNQTLVSHHTQHLSVCGEEIEPQKIVMPEVGAAELRCNSTSIGLEGTFVRWYYEMYPTYKLALFLDSNVSLDPLVKELDGITEVRESGALLLLNNNMLKNNQHFYCLVMKDKNCLSYQNMFLPDHSESRDIFASHGDRLLLYCSSDGDFQEWDTPLGKINDSNPRNNQMYISFSDTPEDYTLVIPAFSDELTGKYSCISPLIELEYSLFLCTGKDTPQKRSVFEGGNVSLECDVSHVNAEKVQWYRKDTSGGHELIHDSNDETMPGPEDLRGRMTLSKNGSCLTLFDLKMEDRKMYWCVVFGPEFLESYDDYQDENDDEEDTEEVEYNDVLNFYETHTCIFKQEHSVLMKKNPPDTKVTNTKVYALVGGLAVILLAAVIAAVIVIKKRSKASGLNTNKDIKMTEDPGCTERLTNNVE
ncbi:uncharacterized protein LOC128359534 [Scomber scombrus]|uniref:Uncharacterized protein LOC128359534 n=2 Tax=Scomber scombrus TaxID=13677 RepID=A0AAV1NPI1_SCOSC